jgi:anti-anti-sigma factor
MADLTLHRSEALDQDDDRERVDRALAVDRGVLIVAAPRSLVTGTRRGFRDHIRQQLNCKPVGIVIDCARSEYIDSSGLALLFSVAKEAKRRGIGFRVARLDEDLRYLLTLTRIDCVISISDSLRSAVLDASVRVEAGEPDISKLLTGSEVGERPSLRLEP